MKRAHIFVCTDAIDRAQPQHQVFIRAGGQRDFLFFINGRAACEDAVYIPGHILHIGIAQPGKIGMRAGSEADILLERPVFHIMTRKKAGQRKIGYFVLLVACLFKQFGGGHIHARLQIVPRNLQTLPRVIHRRVFLKLKPVAGNMLRTHLKYLLQRFIPVFLRLRGQPVDDIQTDV